MKTISLIILFALCSRQCVLCQDTIRYVPTPPVLLNEKERKMKMVLALARNYDRDIGRNFIDFSVPDVLGDTVSNKDLMGKVTFVDFWLMDVLPVIKYLIRLMLCI